MYSVTASAITIGLGLLRTYLMVTFLLPDEVGAAVLALFYVQLTGQLGTFNLNSAYIHKPEANATDLHTFYTMHMLLGGCALVLVMIAAPWIADFYTEYPELQILIWGYAGISLLLTANQAQIAALEKNLVFGQIALLDVCGALAKTIVGPAMAVLGFGPWAVLGEFAGGEITRFALTHFWIRPFRPRLAWNRSAAAWFWDYGRKLWMGSNLTFLVDRFDDFWVGTRLGKFPLGLYSKAYEFARYPRRVIANPLLAVFFPTFAHLQADRVKLSRAFYRATSLIVRAGGLLAVLLLLTAPEFFRLLLPEAWLPMQFTFQLMVVYTFLDPMSIAAQRLLIATGQASEVTRVRWLQLALFIPATFIGAAYIGIAGVAIAADVMIATGTLLLFRHTFKVVDYSLGQMWARPLLTCIGIAAIGLAAEPFLADLPDPWVFALKLILIPAVYLMALLLTERQQVITALSMIRELSGRKP